MASLPSSHESGPISSANPSLASSAGGNIHCCSIGQQSCSCSTGRLAPIMEIREMNSYCNSCVTVGPDKYWNHHPHTDVNRHTTVYPPQMFYTPPPPPPSAHPAPPTNYSTSNSGSGVVTQATAATPNTNEWSCPPSTDSYSHFIYQYQPPPPPPTQHHEYTNFLSISTSCYEPDMMLMSGVSQGASSQVQTVCEPSAPVQAVMNTFMYPTPIAPPAPLPQLPSFSENTGNLETPALSSVTQTQRKSEIGLSTTTLSSTSSTTSSADSLDDSTDEEDEEKRHIISIEDEDNIVDDDEIVMSPASVVSLASSSLRCVLCKKPASLLPASAPSPQLSRILDNIDDDELDISVCSDIEIGGIEDEMIQQATEQQQQQRISLHRLSQLVGVTVLELISREDGYDDGGQNSGEQMSLLCTKCQKLVEMAESLEKQLTSVLTTLRQTLSLEDDLLAERGIKILPANVNSVALQTDDYEVDHQKGHIIVRRNSNNGENSSSTGGESSNHQATNLPPLVGLAPAISLTSDDVPSNIPNYLLCHQCGRHFSCQRNLGKHLKRHHDIPSKGKKPTCPRENCGKVCSDKASLEAHMRKHTGNKPYYCICCLKLFTTKSNLTAHIKSNVCQSKMESAAVSPSPSSIEVNATSYHCENCGLTFRSELRFKRHTSNQTACNKSKLLQCTTCFKPFAKRSELQAHEQAVHTRAKSYICDICGVAFSTRGNQRVHQRTHFNEKRFKCQFCNKGFTRNQTLQAHLANVHK